MRVIAAAQRFLILESTPGASKSWISLQNSLLAGKFPGDRCDQHCVASQPLAQLKIVSALWAKISELNLRCVQFKAALGAAAQVLRPTTNGPARSGGNRWHVRQRHPPTYHRSINCSRCAERAPMTSALWSREAAPRRAMQSCGCAMPTSD